VEALVDRNMLELAIYGGIGYCTMWLIDLVCKILGLPAVTAFLIYLCCIPVAIYFYWSQNEGT
jgi:hypothetical protein